MSTDSCLVSLVASLLTVKVSTFVSSIDFSAEDFTSVFEVLFPRPREFIKETGGN